MQAISTMQLAVISCYLCYSTCTDDGDFAPTASKELEDLVRGCILHCEVSAVEEDGVPYVMLTKVSGNQVIVSDNALCASRPLDEGYIVCNGMLPSSLQPPVTSDDHHETVQQSM